MRSCFKPLQEVWLKWSFVLWSQPVSILLQFLQRAQVDCPKNKIEFVRGAPTFDSLMIQKGPSRQSCGSAWKISGKIIILYTIDNQDADHFCRFSLCFSASTRISRMFFSPYYGNLSQNKLFVVTSILRAPAQGQCFIHIIWKFIRE